MDGNPIVGTSKLKDFIRLLFWSGQSFDEPGLEAEGSFKAAEARYTSDDQIAPRDLKRWLEPVRPALDGPPQFVDPGPVLAVGTEKAASRATGVKSSRRERRVNNCEKAEGTKI